ncbi:hypothetical protein D3C80_1077650 [compost metagenome]
MLVEEIDDIGAQTLQRPLYRLADVVGPAIHVLAAVRARKLEAELRGDHNLVADRLQCLADDILVGERAVDLCRVEEGDTVIVSGADESNCILGVGCRSITVAEPHTSEAKGRDFKCSEGSFFHCHFLDQAAHLAGAASSWDRACRRAAGTMVKSEMSSVATSMTVPASKAWETR